MSTIASLLIRADASPRIGTGHVMRCLALAQQWQQRKGSVLFVSAEITVALEQRLKAESLEIAAVAAAPGSIEDAEQTIAHAHACGTTWIVADGYVFGAAWQKRIKDSGLRLLVIDDYGHAEHYHADIVLNQNASADAQLYTRRDACTRLLLGTRYTLLRQEFAALRDWKREIPPHATKILVSLGGSDPDNVTGTVINELATFKGIEATVVVGGSNPNLEVLQKAIGPQNPHIRLVVNATNMPELMAWADVAISAAGSTSWELAYMGLPSLLIVTADNQAKVAEKLGREGISIDLGWHAALSVEKIADSLRMLLPDASRRTEMSGRARQLVDHRGTRRVTNYLAAAEIKLRDATQKDAHLLWLWANDSDVRASAFNQDPIGWEPHVAWLDGKLREKNSAIYIAFRSSEEPIGQARFNWDKTGVAAVDLSVDQSLRKTGVGSALLRRAVDELFATKPVHSVHALIKPENRASIGAFENADFRIDGPTHFQGHPAVQMVSTSLT